MTFEEHFHQTAVLLDLGDVGAAVAAHKKWCAENMGGDEYGKHFFDVMALGELIWQRESVTKTETPRMIRVWDDDSPPEGRLIPVYEVNDGD